MQWQDVVRSALVGSAKKPLALPTSSTDANTAHPLHALLTHCATHVPVNTTDTTDTTDTLDSVSHYLARAIAAYTLYQRAGIQPSRIATPSFTECVPETRPACTHNAVNLLRHMLHGKQKQLLPQWLAYVAQRGERVPHALLVDLLNAGAELITTTITDTSHNDANSTLHKHIRAVAGERGAWLAQFNPVWHYLLPLPDITDEIWQTSDNATRIRMLTIMRQQNSPHVYALLETTWKQEKADMRRDIVSCLRENLSMADEPFLEDTLDDRSKDVRTTAASLLAKLPESRWCRRMHERVDNALTLSRSAYRNTLTVTLPSATAYDSFYQRDAIIEHVPLYFKPTGGDRAWWLYQMLRAIPPAHWYEQWHITPEALVALAAHSEWQQLLLDAWVYAASNAHDNAMIVALLPQYITHEDTNLLNILFDGLSAEHVEQQMIAMLQKRSKNQGFTVLMRHQQPWGINLARSVIHALAKNVMEHERTKRVINLHYERIRTDALTYALFMPPAIAQEIAYAVPPDSPHHEEWKTTMHDVIALLHVRQAMEEEFAK